MTNPYAKHNYDQPLPQAKATIDAIHIDTKDNALGQFTVKNTGGGNLEGQIICRIPGLSIAPPTWHGGNQIISYAFSGKDSGLLTGESMSGHIDILTNGGQITLPVDIRLAKMSIPTAEGGRITNLQEFYDYAKDHPAQAMRMFVDSEFYMLLLAIQYPHIQVYESLHQDSHRERALDNFFILSGLKTKTTLSITSPPLLFFQKPGDDQPIQGAIDLVKSDPGYVDAPITTQGDAPWLHCFQSRLIQSDFDQDHHARLYFSIDPTKAKGPYNRAVVHIGTAKQDIVLRRTPPVDIKFNRPGYRYQDTGHIAITNHSPSDMKIEVFCKDGFFRPSARSYLVGPSRGAPFQIPFEIKLSPFLNAQVFFRKTPYMHTQVEIKISTPSNPSQIIKKNLPLVVGDW